MDEQYKEEFGFICCFCNQSIIENRTDPIDLDIMHNQDLLNKILQHKALP